MSLRERAKAARRGGDEGDWRADPAQHVLPETQTPVTPESFSAWRAGVEERERLEAAAAAVSIKKSKSENVSALAGLTGRQIFERSGGEEFALQVEERIGCSACRAIQT